MSNRYQITIVMPKKIKSNRLKAWAKYLEDGHPHEVAKHRADEDMNALYCRDLPEFDRLYPQHKSLVRKTLNKCGVRWWE